MLWNLNKIAVATGCLLALVLGGFDALAQLPLAVQTTDFPTLGKKAGDGLEWIGNPVYWPRNGASNSSGRVWISVETQPRGAATKVMTVYRVGEAGWKSAEMKLVDSIEGKDLWTFSVEADQAGGWIQYALEAVDHTGMSRWENNGGRDYFAFVRK